MKIENKFMPLTIAIETLEEYNQFISILEYATRQIGPISSLKNEPQLALHLLQQIKSSINFTK